MGKKRPRKQKKQKPTNEKRYLLIVGITAAVVLLAILFHTMLANQPPAIISLGAEPTSVIPSGSCQIMCYATDPDGDNDDLSYDWSASAGRVIGEGPTINWTAPASLGSYNVTVTVTDVRGGQDTDQTTIGVSAGNPPIITSLLADAAWATPSGSLQVTCTASHPDADELTYEWIATAGNISSTGLAANWTAPQEIGIYNITVVVTDSHGGSATDSLHISVATGQPPKIEALLVTAEHCYLKTYSWGYKVGQGQNYSIECIVSDMSESVYDWSCTGGGISGQGPVITWTAPNESVDVTVTVVVSDVVGNMLSESVLLEVVGCSPCTFGC
jgi:hypothetical protein